MGQWGVVSVRSTEVKHTPIMSASHSKVFDSVCQIVGNTPLVRLHKIAQEVDCEIWAKCEFLNPGGSIKDRIGVRMVEEAEKSGRIQPGDTLIEPTSGNTGIGLALACAVKGYRLIITMPEKMSQEKQVVLEALGAEIIRTPTEAAFDSPESHIGVAKRLSQVIPGSHILDQYSNLNNPRAHYEGTAKEILAQTGDDLDAIVVSAGTGGTITGIAEYCKEHAPKVQIIGVDPEGSILAGPGPIRSYKVEGIGYDFIPDVLKRDLVDKWIKTKDRDSFRIARQLIRQEGLLVGGSSGAAVCAALQVAKDLPSGSKIVVILPDSVRNYLTKFVQDSWMRQHGFLQSDWEMGTVADVLRALPTKKVTTVEVDSPLSAVVRQFKQLGISQMPVVDDGKLAGILTESDVLQYLVSGKYDDTTTVAEVMVRVVSTIAMHAEASILPQIFERGEVAIVTDMEKRIKAILTKMDLIELLARRELH